MFQLLISEGKTTTCIPLLTIFSAEIFIKKIENREIAISREIKLNLN